jgi:MFS family permease
MIVQFESAVVFVQPPYKWQTHDIGLLALSGLIGTVLAIFIGGRLIDMIANNMTAKNGGVRQPEYRLKPLLIPAVIGPMGTLIYGLTVAAKTHWVGPAFGYGMQGFGLTACSNILATYAVDSCHGVRSSREVAIASLHPLTIIVCRRSIGLLLCHPFRHCLHALLVGLRLDCSSWC